MKFLKNVIKNALREFIKEDSIQLAKKSIEHIILARDTVNIITIDCGMMSIGKANEYLDRILQGIKKLDPCVQVVLVQKRS